MRDRDIDAAKAQFNGRVSGRRVHHRVGHQNRIDGPRSLGKQRVFELRRDVGRAERAPKEDAHAIAVFSRDGDACIGKREAGRCGC